MGLSSHAAGTPVPAGAALADDRRADRTLHAIQALRFIAAALVVVSHIRNEYGLEAFGSQGVDIFFVISGFIIQHVTRQGAPQFVARRLIRILPLYWLGTLGLAAVALVAPGVLHQVAFDPVLVLKSLLFIPTWNEDFQYHLPLLLLGWSLNYEMLFYLVYFIALRISHRHRMLLASLMLVGLSLLHPHVAPQSALAFWSDAYILEFIYGMLLGQLLNSSRFIEHARLGWGLALAGFVLYCWAMLPSTGLVSERMALDKTVRVLVIGLPSMALVLLTLGCEQSVRRLGPRTKASLNFLGELSYPVYIFHIYVMGVLKRLGALELGVVPYVLLVTAATLGVSAVVFLVYEQPFRAWLGQRLLRRPGRMSSKVLLGSA